jgi:transketolase
LILINGSSSSAIDAKAELEKRSHAVRGRQHAEHEPFAKQDEAYRESVLPTAIRRRLAIEAGAPETWYRWVGLDGDVVGMTTFGASAPVNDVMKHFGFTVENVVAHALKLIER